MTSRDFCYWLQGYFELNVNGPTPHGELTAAQVKAIKNHLSMVFIHEIDPTMGPKPHQDKLTQAHAGLARPPHGFFEEPKARC